MTDLSSLLARIESATGPDREIDDAIRALFGGFLPFSALTSDDVVRIDGNLVVASAVPRSTNNQAYHLPRYTASIDAAKNLLLPAYGYRIEWMPNGHPSERAWATCGLPGEQDGAYGYTVELALCAAIIKARMET